MYNSNNTDTKFFGLQSAETIKNEAGLKDALDRAGLGYEVKSVQMSHPNNPDQKIPFYATVRTDTQDVLGAGLSDRYKVIQNLSGLGTIADIAGQREDGVIMSRALSFDRGRIAVAQVDLGSFTVGDTGAGGFSDQVNKRITFTNSHDGSGSATVFTTPIRVVCWNTLSAAMTGARDKVSIRHTASADRKLVELTRIMRIIDGQMQRTEIAYNVLAKTKITKDDFGAILEKLFPAPASAPERTKNHQNEIKGLVASYFADADGGRIERDTAWNTYNAITRFTDHDSTVRTDGTATGFHATREAQSLARVQSVLLGSIATQNANALETIVEATGIEAEITRLIAGVQNQDPVTAPTANVLDWMLT
jgi:phage/plasmid-like protein (TIGR03299 family)